MSASFPSFTLAASAFSPRVEKWAGSARLPSNILVHFRRSFPRIFASTGNASSSVGTGMSTEMDDVSSFSEIVPDTVIFDDFEKFPPTAATVSSSLLLGICSLPDTKFKSAVETALADGECYERVEPSDRMSCFFNKALVNVGADLARLVPGRVSTEVDARLAYDTQGIIHKVHELLRLYNEVGVSSERLLFKIPSTWQGIEASRLLEAEGIQTHLTFVYSFPQAAAAAQAGASVIQIFVGRIRDWARNHSGDSHIEAACKGGQDPGLALVIKAYNYIHKYGHKSKLMAAAIRNKQDLFGLLGVDYIIAPLKILQSLKESVTFPDEKYSYVRRLAPSSAKEYDFSDDEVKCQRCISSFCALPVKVSLPHNLPHQSYLSGLSVHIAKVFKYSYIGSPARVRFPFSAGYTALTGEKKRGVGTCRLGVARLARGLVMPEVIRDKVGGIRSGHPVTKKKSTVILDPKFPN